MDKHLPPPLVVVVKDMAYSRREFLAQFKLFAKQRQYHVHNNQLSLALKNFIVDAQGLENTSAQVVIKLNNAHNRNIGALSIPRLSVNFEFAHCSRVEQIAFIKQFDLSFRRGGG